MPPSGRKGKSRARRAPAATETHTHDHSEAEPEAIATPSRGSRKRARGTEAAAPAARNTRRKIKDTRTAEDTEGTEPHDPSDNETEPSTPSEEDIIQCLRVADKKVHATEDFANELLEGQESVPGYGKIAGRDWVYIIRKVEVNIGRPEEHQRLEHDPGQHAATPTAKTVVDIDLGPDRQISRLHAAIAYDSDSMQWYILVNGRNGLRVDNNLQKRGSKTYLRNGSVIEIAGTQMAFITTPNEDGDGPIWDASILKQAQKSSEDDDEGDEDPRSTNNRNANPSGRSNLQDTGMYQSNYGGQQQHSQPGQAQPQQRMHPHSQRAALQATPGTPMRSQTSFPKSSPAATYSRGMQLESTESIDYSQENAKDLKPPHSYAQLIGMAILSTHEQQMTLNNIYKWIMANYAFYRFNTGGWQNSIRHNLSLNKAFTKIARRTDEPGKGMKWMIEPTEYDNFVQQGMKGCRRPNPIPGTHSNMGSPTSPKDRSRGTKREDDLTPPLNTYRPPYPTAMEAYTPDRGPRQVTNPSMENNMSLGLENGGLVDYDYPQRATPRHGMNGLNAIAHAAGSPPALYVNDEGRVGPLDTPFPLRPSQRLAPPSTLRRPSDFIQFSSPAPFWKMEGLVGSTPFKPFDLSPLKTPFPALKKSEGEEKQAAEDHDEEEDEDEEDEQRSSIERSTVEPATDVERKPQQGSPIIGSSSPPLRPTSGIEASPTVSRPATAVAKTLSQMSQEQHGPEKTPPGIVGTTAPAVQQHTPPNTASASSQPAARTHELPQTSVASNFEAARPAVNNAYNNNTYTANTAPQTNVFHAADDGEDEGIDLVK